MLFLSNHTVINNSRHKKLLARFDPKQPSSSREDDQNPSTTEPLSYAARLFFPPKDSQTALMVTVSSAAEEQTSSGPLADWPASPCPPVIVRRKASPAASQRTTKPSVKGKVSKVQEVWCYNHKPEKLMVLFSSLNGQLESVLDLRHHPHQVILLGQLRKLTWMYVRINHDVYSSDNT